MQVDRLDPIPISDIVLLDFTSEGRNSSTACTKKILCIAQSKMECQVKLHSWSAGTACGSGTVAALKAVKLRDSRLTCYGWCRESETRCTQAR